MQSILASLPIASARESSTFDTMMFVGFLGATITLACWFARHVSKTDRPLAIPLLAFVGLAMLIVATLPGRGAMGAIVLSVVAANEAAIVVRFVRRRFAERRRAPGVRWSVDPTRHERLFGVPRAGKFVERPRGDRPGTRAELDDDDDACEPAC